MFDVNDKTDNNVFINKTDNSFYESLEKECHIDSMSYCCMIKTSGTCLAWTITVSVPSMFKATHPISVSCYSLMCVLVYIFVTHNMIEECGQQLSKRNPEIINKSIILNSGCVFCV